MHTTDFYPESVHAAARALYAAMGTPVRSPLKVDGDGESTFSLPSPDHEGEDIHPVFGLMAHYLGNDDYQAKGIASNPFRGDHAAIPCYSEMGMVGLIEISFHKGRAYAELITYPDAPEPVAEACVALLTALETR